MIDPIVGTRPESVVNLLISPPLPASCECIDWGARLPFRGGETRNDESLLLSDERYLSPSILSLALFV